NGKIDLGDGFRIEPPKLFDERLVPLSKRVAWKLNGNILSLTFDDAGLQLPYIIDPDATAPDIAFVQWSESSPYAHYDSTQDINLLWFNPNETGSATARVTASDAETGVQYVTWPSGPAGWNPAGGNDSSATDANGIQATYYDNAQANSYPGSNFTGTSFSRIDPNVDFDWGAGTPYAALGNQTFSIIWTGK